MATATKPATKFGVVCPYCGDADAVVRIDLNDLKACTCSNCDQEFSPRQAMERAAEQLRKWTAIVRWTEMAGEAMAEVE